MKQPIKKIAFCDLEGTLIEVWGWWHIKDCFGAKKLSDEYTELYHEGKVGFEEWRQELAKIWRKNKVTKKEFEKELSKNKFLPGAKKLITGLKEKGYYVVIITGAVSVQAELVGKELGADEVISANKFEFDKKGVFTGINTHPAYRRGQGKVHFIKETLAKYKIDKKDCIAIGGDDINDLWMMKELKSFAVKPKIRQIKEAVDHIVEKLVDILKYV